MKSDPFTGRFNYVSKAVAHQLGLLARAIAENGGIVPEGAKACAESLARELARAWTAGNVALFVELADLLARGTPPDKWEHPPTYYARRALFEAPTVKRETKDGQIFITRLPCNVRATASHVVRLAKADGVTIAPRVAQIALAEVGRAVGFKPRRGRTKGAKDSKEAAAKRQAVRGFVRYSKKRKRKS